MRIQKTVLITDLDNTLFDWVDLWYKCFSTMLDEIVRTSDTSKEIPIPEIRAVHQKYGTSEYSLLIEELPSLRTASKGSPATQVFAGAIDAYRKQRNEHLKLFPTVGETLLKIKGRGTQIVGYTESMGFYSNYRIRRLGLDGVLDYLFCPEDHVLPQGMTPEQLRKYPATHYTLRYTKQHFTPKGSKKPDTEVLNANLGLDKRDCVYVGDSLLKDVTMAQDCSIADVWAEYGQAHKRPEYKLLQDVTHWTLEEVEREQRIKAREHVHPTHTLTSSFSELLDHFEFKDRNNEAKMLTDENKKQIIDIWKTIVGVQQHFNDIEMRIRSMFVTILLALIASIGFLMDKKLSFSVGKINVQFATIVPLIGVLGAGLFYFIDRYWYHRLLVGSVKHAIDIEKKYKDEIPELSLSDAIGRESPFKPRGWLFPFAARLLVKDPRFKTTGNLHSDGKIELFYKSVMVVLCFATVMIATLGGVTIADTPIWRWWWNLR
jgi:phosphoglycolate phosphatase-like HAD superfamily hydrolase